MPHWSALALPALPLQLARRRFDAVIERTLAIGVIEGPAQRARVAFCNEAARALGVTSGMKLAAAQALARHMITIPRDTAREHEAVQELCGWAYQFSPAVVAFDAGLGWGLLIETGASERLFGGRQALRERMLEGLRQLGYEAFAASAPTPAAARLLAAAGAQGLLHNPSISPKPAFTAADSTSCPEENGEALAHRLRALPVHMMGWSDVVTDRLCALGLSTLGDVMALPRDAFARRFGTAVLIDLDRLLGRIPDPQPAFTPRGRFKACIELPADTEDTNRLIRPLEGLLRLLEGFLRGHNAGATALLLCLQHSARRDQPIAPTRVPLGLAAPERDPPRLLQLFAERLSRARLPAPAVKMELQLEHMGRFTPVTASFLPPSPQQGTPDASILHLAETLHARLGSEGVFQLQAVSDHRPEYAYRITPLSPEPPRQAPLPPAPAQRPTLILPRPQALACGKDTQQPAYRGALAMLAGPERIEAGWWDLAQAGRATVHRDYFVARNPHGQTLWVYRELAAPHRWFLHGFFA